MPTYSTAARDGLQLEAVQSFSGPSLTVLNCGGPLHKVFGSISILFKVTASTRTTAGREARRAAAAKQHRASSATRAFPQPRGPLPQDRRRLLPSRCSCPAPGRRAPGRRAARATDRCPGPTSGSSAGRASPPSSMTSRRSRSTRRTARPRLPSPSATSAAVASRSSLGTDASTSSHLIASPTGRTCGRYLTRRSGDRQALRRRLICGRTCTQESSWWSISSSIAWNRPTRSSTDPRSTVSFADPCDASMRSAFVGAARRLQAPRPRRGTWSSSKEAALLDPCRVALVHVDGMGGHQHDRPSRPCSLPSWRSHARRCALITDYDVGLEERRAWTVSPVTQEMVFAFFEEQHRACGRSFSKRSPRCP